MTPVFHADDRGRTVLFPIWVVAAGVALASAAFSPPSETAFEDATAETVTHCAGIHGCGSGSLVLLGIAVVLPVVMTIATAAYLRVTGGGRA